MYEIVCYRPDEGTDHEVVATVRGYSLSQIRARQENNAAERDIRQGDVIDGDTVTYARTLRMGYVIVKVSTLLGDEKTSTYEAGNCPRGQHSRQGNIGMRGELTAWCSCGGEWPCPSAVVPDSDYSNCAATHAEANAISYADPRQLPYATLYVTRRPCPACQTLINAAGIARVVTPEGEME